MPHLHPPTPVFLKGTLARNAPQRAAQLRTAIERLGPAYVKVAQALSTRVDLLEEAYLREIEALQDRVPPFDTALALVEMEAGRLRRATGSLVLADVFSTSFASSSSSFSSLLRPSCTRAPPQNWQHVDIVHTMAEPHFCTTRSAHAFSHHPPPAFQAPVSSVVASLSAAPVAAASLGQVYFATLSPAFASQQVAIKVRRPRVLESVSLDLYLMRRVALALRDVPEVRVKEHAHTHIATCTYTRAGGHVGCIASTVEMRRCGCCYLVAGRWSS